MTRLPTFCLLAAPLALAACGTAYQVVPLPDGRLRTPNATETGAYCAERGGRPRMLGIAPGNTEVLFECVKD
ncbi:MAG: hypothetical protein QM586_02065 [Xenophilus sp.]